MIPIQNYKYIRIYKYDRNYLRQARRFFLSANLLIAIYQLLLTYMASQDLELIKSKVDLVDFLKSYIRLLPAGKNLKGLCPFHQEKTPSFVVSPERKIWHCFGCGVGGDAIKFVMLYENLEFPAALRHIAEKLGIVLSQSNLREQREFGVLYDIHASAKNFFQAECAKNEIAKNYLKERNLNQDTINEFELGFAPGGETLTVYLLKSGFAIADIVKAGLSHKNVNGLFRDKFSQRIVFPIYNSVGKVIAFTGRLVPELQNQKYDIEPPKYLNSPETPIFNKSKILYGLHKTKQEIVKTKSAFLVEGQMDFLSVWQAGVKNVVAVSGTGLTEQHLAQLRRMADVLMVSFDNDNAGIKALERSLEVFSRFDFHIKAVNLENFKDPAEAIQAEPKFFETALPKARPAFIHLFDYYFSKLSDEPDLISAKKRIVRDLLLKLKAVKSVVERDMLLAELARFSGVSSIALEAELTNLIDVIPKEFVEETAKTETNPLDRINLIAERLLVLGFTKQEFYDTLRTNIDFMPLAYHNLLQNPESEAAGFFAMRASYASDIKDELNTQKEFQTLIKNLELEYLKKENENLKEKISLAENKDDDEDVAVLLVKFNEISKRINELKL